MVKVRAPGPRDAARIALWLRAADRDEAAAAGITNVAGAILDGIQQSTLCWVAEDETGPVAVFGVRPHGDTAAPWMLCTEGAVERHRCAFIRGAPHYIAAMLGAYPRLSNCVHAGNAHAVRWLRRAGFALGPAWPHPTTGALFHTFTLDRDARPDRATVG